MEGAPTPPVAPTPAPAPSPAPADAEADAATAAEAAAEAAAARSVEALSRRVALLKARYESARVEGHERARALACARGREPTAEELAADAHAACWAREARVAGAALGRAREALASAQAREKEEAAEAARAKARIGDAREAQLARLAALRAKPAPSHAAGAATSDVGGGVGGSADDVAETDEDWALLGELMTAGEELVASTGAILGVSGAPPALGAPGAGPGVDARMQSQLLDLMGDLQSKMDRMQQTQDAMAEENKRLRERPALSSRRGPRAADGDADSDDDDDRATLGRYMAVRRSIMELLASSATPSSDLYAERDLHLYRLSDADLRAEYEWYMRLYIDDGAS